MAKTIHYIIFVRFQRTAMDVIPFIVYAARPFRKKEMKHIFLFFFILLRLIMMVAKPIVS